MSARTLAFVLLALGVVSTSASAQSLRGSRAKVTRVHNHAVEEGLEFHRTSRAVTASVREGALVRLSGNADYRVNDGVRWPYVRPEAEVFVTRLASQYRAACGEQLVVTSAVRPQDQQPWNASDRSVHPTGIAVDFRKPRGRCLTWLRSTLASLQSRGLIDATEEFRPPHFHVVVFPTPYAKYVQARTGRSVASNASATRSYRVRRGDTLWGIAKRHGVTVSRLRALNELRSSTIHPGEQLLVPVR